MRFEENEGNERTNMGEVIRNKRSRMKKVNRIVWYNNLCA